MTTLTAAPAELIDPSTHKPRFGTYVGGLPTVDFTAAGASLLQRFKSEKRWMYVILASDELVFCTAVIRLGYASNAFAFAIDRATGKPIADMTAKGPAFLASVSERASEGARARFSLGSKSVSIERPWGSKDYSVEVRGHGLKLDARLSTANAPQPISVIAALRGDFFSTTEKGALLEVEGSLLAAGKRYDLKGAYAGYDYTAGLLERRTAWKWAFALGKCSAGKPLAYNLTEGFVGERECVAWADGDVHHLSAARFTFDPKRMMQPWQIRTDSGACDVDFDTAYLHSEEHNALVLQSSFKQIAGAFRGKLVLPNDRTIAFEKLAGVTEDQDTLW
jgi:hypothetical protein